MKTGGFTLVELMITIAVAAILLATATPSFTSLIQNHRLVAQHNDFVANLNLARSEAVKRSARHPVQERGRNPMHEHRRMGAGLDHVRRPRQ